MAGQLTYLVIETSGTTNLNTDYLTQTEIAKRFKSPETLDKWVERCERQEDVNPVYVNFGNTFVVVCLGQLQTSQRRLAPAAQTQLDDAEKEIKRLKQRIAETNPDCIASYTAFQQSLRAQLEIAARYRLITAWENFLVSTVTIQTMAQHYTELNSTKCKDGHLPDGPVCPQCGGARGPSGVDGGTWIHVYA